MRRGFFDLHAATGSPVAAEALQRIGDVYRVEDDARGRPPDVRARLRRVHAAPRLADIKAWLETTRAKLSGKSELAKPCATPSPAGTC